MPDGPLSRSKIPQSPDDITVEWMSRVFKDASLPDHGKMVSVEAEPTEAGFGAQCTFARLAISYSHPVSGVPESVFAKFSAGVPMSDLVSSWEVRFYREVAPEVSLRIPRCYFAATDKDSARSLILLEDLSRGRGGDTVIGCTDQEAELILQQLALFHADWWESAEFAKWPWLQRAGEMTDDADGGIIPIEARDLFYRKHGSLMPGWADRFIERAIYGQPEIAGLLHRGPRTLTHQDLQTDNIRFGLLDSPIVILDWQLAMCAQGAADVAYFLATSLTVPQRRVLGDHLIEVYHAALVEAGVHDYSMKSLLSHIKPWFLHYIVRMVGFGAYADFTNERSRKLIAALIERNMALLEDYDLWEGLSR